MTLLQDIQAAAVDEQMSVASLLRKCLLLAHRLDNQQLRSWANRELEGYGGEDPLPPYRTCQAAAYGNFLGLGHAQRNRTLIPPSSLESAHHHFAEVINLRSSVAAYEGLLDRARAGDLSIPWPGDLVLHYQTRLLAGWQLTGAYQPVPPGVLPALLDAVRTNVLNLVIELERTVPGAGEPDTMSAKASREVDRLVQTVVFGNNNNVLVQSPAAVLVQVVGPRDFDSLHARLADLGIPPSETDDLRDAIAADEATGANGPGPRVQSWYGSLARKAASGSIDVGTSVIGSGVWSAILAFFGN